MAKSAAERFRLKLVALRRERGLTQEQAAERALISYKTYQHLEIGIRDNPTLKIIEKLASGFQIEIHEMLSPEMPRQKPKQEPKNH